MKKHSNKELAMTKKDSEDFKTSTRYAGFVIMNMLMVMLK